MLTSHEEKAGSRNYSAHMKGPSFVHQHSDFLRPHAHPLTDDQSDIGNKFQGDLRMVRADCIKSFRYPGSAVDINTVNM
jgi:hypothetical protein